MCLQNFFPNSTVFKTDVNRSKETPTSVEVTQRTRGESVSAAVADVADFLAGIRRTGLD